MKRVQINEDPLLRVELTPEHAEYVTKVADKRRISRAALLRKWLVAGERAESATIPDFDDTQSIGTAAEQSPIEQLFLETLPDESDQAMSPDEIIEEMKDGINDKVWELVREAEYIDGNGGEIYYANGE